MTATDHLYLCSQATDWAATLSRRQRTTEVAFWLLSASLVLGLVAGVSSLAQQLDMRTGQQAALDAAILVDLPPLPPAPSLSFAAEAAPDAPMVDAPQSSEPVPEPADRLIKMPLALEPPMVAPTAVEQLVPADQPDAPPDTMAPPPIAPEPVVQPKPEPDNKVAEINPAKPPAFSAASRKASPKSSADSTSDGSVSAGRVRDLKATWGASIRKKVERRKSYPVAAGRAQGTTTVRLTVTRSGTLVSASVAKSSGNPELDSAALKAVQSAGRFASAPEKLTEANYGFDLPINFSR